MNRAVLILTCALTGCSPLLQTPQNFLRLKQQEGEYNFRATSADGVVLAGRVLNYDKDLGGGLTFWIDAIKQHLQSSVGYALLKEQEIASARGLKGKQLRFGHDQKRGTYQYWVSVFVKGDELVVIEAGGPEAKLAAHEAEISKAIASVDP